MIPTLIIGLGGAGSRVVANVYKKFMESNPTKEECQRFVCLNIDTDARDRCAMLPSENVVNIAPDIPLSLEQNVREGTGMDRMVGRLAFQHAEKELRLGVVENSIKHLRYFDHSIKVCVVTSLAGGTGSGIFLQIAHYVKDVLNRLGLSDSIDGYFIHGNVFSNTLPAMVQKKLIANTSASIKELKEEIDKGVSPYDFCYMMDSDMLSKPLPVEDCYKMLADFVFYPLFTLTGDSSYNLVVNNIRQRIATEGGACLSLFGLSKLVYPVDDLFAYFARQQFVDLLTEWCKIDKGCKYESDRGVMFMRDLEDLRYCSGRRGLEYRIAYQSTQRLGKDEMIVCSKAQDYLEYVERYVKNTIADNVLIQGLCHECDQPNEFASNADLDDAWCFVERRERALEEFKATCQSFVADAKKTTIEKCSLFDGYLVDAMPLLGTRYFLYDVRESIMSLLERLVYNNKRLEQKIDEYKKAFDYAETRFLEGPKENLSLADRKTNWFTKLMGKNFYKEAKEEYLFKSREQAEAIKDYATNKLFEETLRGILEQVKNLIVRTERFFDAVPDMLREIEEECQLLLEKHDKEGENNIDYVLTSKDWKTRLYQDVDLKSDLLDLPIQLNSLLFHTLKSPIDSFSLSDVRRGINVILNELEKQLKNDCPDLSQMNVVQALGKESEGDIETMVKKLDEVRKIASFKYKGWSFEDRPYNFWEMNPSCVSKETFTEQETDMLFGLDDENFYRAAALMTSVFISPFEIVRINTLNLLRIEHLYHESEEK